MTKGLKIARFDLGRKDFSLRPSGASLCALAQKLGRKEGRYKTQKGNIKNFYIPF
jgi:hypothetical protein